MKQPREGAGGLPPTLAAAAPNPLGELAMMSEITKALVQFQKNCPAIVKDKKAEVTSRRTGGKFEYQYADLAGILNAIRPVLSDCGLFLTQVFDNNGSVLLVTRIMHEGGELIASTIDLPVNGLAPQEAGSVITYYRRYALMALLGLAADDDDGAAATTAGAAHGKQPAAALTKQLKDSIASEQEGPGKPAAHIAASRYANDPAYAPYLKTTPDGKCWKITAIENGDGKGVAGIRDFVRDLEAQYDADELKRFLADNSVLLDACAIALPSWYYGKSGSDIPGIEKRISDARARLAKPAAADRVRMIREGADDPERYLKA